MLGGIQMLRSAVIGLGDIGPVHVKAIKGLPGAQLAAGKTTFLLQYAKEKFGTDRSCLFINMNNFYFSKYTLVDFAGEFVKRGGKVLLIDQVFKYPEWSHDLRACYEKFPGLKIVFTGSSVMRLKEENPELSGIVKVYYLRGFSFREFLNLQSGNNFRAYTLQEILENHEQIAKTILRNVKPLDFFQDYLHHGFYPFFLEKRNFSENLLKTMNMMIEAFQHSIFQPTRLHNIKVIRIMIKVIKTQLECNPCK